MCRRGVVVGGAVVVVTGVRVCVCVCAWRGGVQEDYIGAVGAAYRLADDMTQVGQGRGRRAMKTRPASLAGQPGWPAGRRRSGWPMT